MMRFLKKHKEGKDERCPRTRDRKATERALLASACRLFAEKGYENTRTLEIAKEAGVNEALILRYFGGKEGLLTAVFKDEEFLSTLITTKSNPICCNEDELLPTDPKLSVKQAVRAFYKNAQAFVDMKAPFMRIACSRALVDQEMADVVRVKLAGRQRDILKARLKTIFGQKNVEISETDVESVAQLLTAVNFVMNFMGRKVFMNDPEQIDQALELFAELIENYFSNKSARSGNDGRDS